MFTPTFCGRAIPVARLISRWSNFRKAGRFGSPGHRTSRRQVPVGSDVVVQDCRSRVRAGRLPATDSRRRRLRNRCPGWRRTWLNRESSQGRYASLRWFERRIIDDENVPPARSRIWWRPDGDVPDDPVLTASLVAYFSAVTLTEPAFAARGSVGESAQRDHPSGSAHRRCCPIGFFTNGRPRAVRTRSLQTRRCSTATAILWCARSAKEDVFSAAPRLSGTGQYVRPSWPSAVLRGKFGAQIEMSV